MMLNMTEADYESWRDDLRCGGREEYDNQYTAASLYAGGWRADALPDLIEQFNLTGDEAERIYNELLEIEQKTKGKEETSTFNRIFENARSVNIQSNEWFNYAGFFWMQCTEKQLAKMRMLLKAQGCKTTVKNGEEWYILNSGTLMKVH